MILQDKDRQGSAKMITFLAAQGRRLDRAQPDGNILFRSLSKQLFESDIYHGELRMILSEYAASYPAYLVAGLSRIYFRNMYGR